MAWTLSVKPALRCVAERENRAPQQVSQYLLEKNYRLYMYM